MIATHWAVRHAALDVGFDAYGRPLLTLIGTPDSESDTHVVLLESLRPTVQGFCITCFESHMRRRANAGRRARSCSAMVAYLGHLNRDRAMRTRLEGELRRVRDLEHLLVS